MARPVVNLYRLGRLPYVKALNVQQVLFETLKAGVIQSQIIDNNNNKHELDFHATGKHVFKSSDTKFTVQNSLILVEHEPVYTIGLRNSQYNSVYEDKLRSELERHNFQADFFRTNRGGLITFHGPGQLVAYPILYLGDFKKIKNRSVKAYVGCLEATIIDTLARLGLEGAHTVQEHPGVWLDGGRRKIAFVGIACKRFVTMHGLSINCNCDLRWFDHIVSCGIEDKAITSIHQEMLLRYQLKRDHSLPATSDLSSWSPSASDSRQQQPTSEPLECIADVGRVSETFCESFSQIFDCSLLEKQQHELNPEIANLVS